MVKRYALVGLGGMAGASIRWAVSSVIHSTNFPWSIFLVNLIGSCALGLILAQELSHPKARLWLHDFGGIGFCGGLTTMSSFATGAVILGDGGQMTLAVEYVLSMMFSGLVAMLLGAALGHQIKALVQPLEEQP